MDNRWWHSVPTDGQPLADFSVTASFTEQQVILALTGEVDVLTAPDFRAFFEAMIDRGHRSVVLDLAGLRFMDASGLAILASGAARLEHSGGTLAIYTPVDLIRRMLHITGFSRLVVLAPLESNYGHLGSEQSTKQSGDPIRVGSYGTGNGAARYTGIHFDEEVVDGTLRLAVSLAHVAVGGADGVSVSLRRDGRLATVAATDQTISRMDANQYETGEGPCVDASNEGRWFHSESLGSETRWPAFTPRARALGINAILSSPLVVEDRPVGALNIYSLSKGAFSPRDQELARAFATETSLLLSEAGAEVTDDQLSLRFQGALRLREVIAQAQGVLMERHGLTALDAYRALRRFSLGSNTPLRERAEEIVSSARPAEDAGDADSSNDAPEDARG
jgi:anti-anti-sigma factor